MTDTLHFSVFEKILIGAGLLFFANVIYIASGGDFTLLYIAKGAYLLGIILLVSKFITSES